MYISERSERNRQILSVIYFMIISVITVVGYYQYIAGEQNFATRAVIAILWNKAMYHWLITSLFIGYCVLWIIRLRSGIGSHNAITFLIFCCGFPLIAFWFLEFFGTGKGFEAAVNIANACLVINTMFGFGLLLALEKER